MTSPAQPEPARGFESAAGFAPTRADLVAAALAAALMAAVGAFILTEAFWSLARGAAEFLARKTFVTGSGLSILWNPRNGLGAPLLADPRFGAIYPLNFIFYLGSGRPAFAVFALFHLGLFSGFLYALLRATGSKTPVAAATALVGAGVFFAAAAGSGFGGFVSVAWAPVVAFCLRRRLMGGDPFFTTAAGLAFGLSLLAGSLTAAGAGTATAILMLMELERRRAHPAFGFADLLRPLFLALALGTLLGAGQVVPSWLSLRPVDDEFRALAANAHLARVFGIRPGPDSLPRAFSLPEARWVADREQALKAVAAPGFTGREYVVLEGRPPAQAGPRMGNTFWPMKLLADENDRVEVLMDSKRPGYLVLLDAYDRDWRALVNGQPVPIFRANGFFRAVEVGTEVSRVEFYYQPPATVVGILLSLLGAALVGFLFFLRRPRSLWWTLWAVILVLTPMVEGGTTYIPVAVLRVVVLAMAALWALGLRADGGTFIRTRLDFFVLGFWLLAAASTGGSAYFYISFYWYLNITAFVLLYFVTVQFAAGDAGTGRRLLALAAAAGAAQSVWAVAEIGRVLRSSAGYFNPSYLAGSLMIVSPYLLARALADWRQSRARAAGWGAMFALLTAGIVASEARAVVVWPAALLLAGWPGAVTLFESSGRSPRQARRLAAAALAGGILTLAIGLALVPNPLRDRIRDIHSDRFAFERVRIWSAAAAMVRDHPLGVGPGMFRYYSRQYRFPIDSVMAGRYERVAENAHSEYLNLAAEMSPLALLCAVIPAVGLIGAAARAGARRRDPLLSGAAGGMAAAALHALFDTNLHDHALATLAVMMAAVAAAELGRREPRFAWPLPLLPAGVRLLQAGLVALLAVGLFGNFLLAYSYRLTLLASSESEASRASVRLTEAVDNSMGNEQPWRQLAELYLSIYRQEDDPTVLPKAEKAASTARLLNPADPENYRLLGEVNLEMYLTLHSGELGRAAAKMFDEALRRDPFNVDTIRGMARLRAAAGDRDGEARWLTKALALEPYDLRSRADLVRSLVKAGRAEPARKQLIELIARRREVEEMRRQHPTAIRSSYQLQRVGIEAREIGELEYMVTELDRHPVPDP